VAAQNVVIPPGWNEFEFTCPNSGCFNTLNGGQDVTVFEVVHHMHGAGRSMRTRLYDASDNLYKEMVTEFYDFNFQDYLRIEPFTFRTDTHASVECIYESNGEDFGLGSEQEMCMTFLTYYPSATTDPRYCGYHQDEYGFGFPGCTTNQFATGGNSSVAPELDWQTFTDSPGVCNSYTTTTEEPATTTSSPTTEATADVTTEGTTDATTEATADATTDGTTDVTTDATTDVTTEGTSPNPAPESSSSDDNTVIIAAGVGGGVAVVLLVVALFICRGKKIEGTSTTKSSEMIQTHSSELDNVDL